LIIFYKFCESGHSHETNKVKMKTPRQDINICRDGGGVQKLVNDLEVDFPCHLSPR
jgi:hypothetical protein